MGHLVGDGDRDWRRIVLAHRPAVLDADERQLHRRTPTRFQDLHSQRLGMVVFMRLVVSHLPAEGGIAAVAVGGSGTVAKGIVVGHRRMVWPKAVRRKRELTLVSALPVYPEQFDDREAEQPKATRLLRGNHQNPPSDYDSMPSAGS
jgi:hypothetical protein